tara:strand:+ start:1357 stop:2919 length:1563 start_codon:yes stop_codon:yes gene_type:complete
MAATLELKYFNSYWLKKIKSIVDADTDAPPAPPTSPYNTVPRIFTAVAADDWYIEEARIRGGYNNTITDLGVKAHLVEDNPNNQNRFNSLIYSGVFNSRTGINQTNEFSVGEDIARSVDPSNGSIQKLYAEDTNLIIFQEDKVSRALIDKDAIYSAEGNPMVTSTNLVIGQIVPYAGKYGIATDPYSFAVYGYRKYFTDRKRGCVLRLSKDGLTEISSYGMHDFFRDELSGNIEKIVGGWDMHTKNYILSIQNTPGTSWVQATSGASAYGPGNGISVTLSAPNSNLTAGMNIYNNTTGVYYGYVVSVTSTTILVCNLAIQVPAATTLVFKIEDYKTVTFDEGVLGWTSLLDYKPSWMFSLVSDFYSTFTGKAYKHYGDSDYSNFYGIEFDSTVTVILNAQPSVMKVFKTINYEGGSNWTVTTATASSGDIGQVPIARYILPTSLVDFENELFTNSFKKKENKYFANILNNSPATPGEVIFGENMTGIKGFFSTIKLTLDNSINEKRELFAVSSETVESSY